MSAISLLNFHNTHVICKAKSLLEKKHFYMS